MPIRILYEDHKKHHPFAWVPESHDKMYVLTIRRLPCFFSSYINMCVTNGIYPYYEPLPPPSIEDVVDVRRTWGYVYNQELPGPLANIGDRYIRHMTSDFLFPVSHCLRMEHLREDIIQLVSPYTSIPKHFFVERKESAYDHDPFSCWTRDQIEAMYSNNPEWAKLELQYYNSILIG